MNLQRGDHVDGREVTADQPSKGVAILTLLKPLTTAEAGFSRIQTEGSEPITDHSCSATAVVLDFVGGTRLSLTSCSTASVWPQVDPGCRGACSSGQESASPASGASRCGKRFVPFQYFFATETLPAIDSEAQEDRSAAEHRQGHHPGPGTTGADCRGLGERCLQVPANCQRS